MTTVLAILNIIQLALVVLKAIPQTSAIATEISDFEVAFQNVLSSATVAADKASKQVDPTQLNLIEPIS